MGSAVIKNLHANRLSNFPIPHNKRCIIRLTMASTFSDDELAGKSSKNDFFLLIRLYLTQNTK